MDAVDFEHSSGMSGISPFLANAAKSGSGKIFVHISDMTKFQHSRSMVNYFQLEVMSEWVGFNGTSTQFRSFAPSLTQKAGTESTTVKESQRYINLANTI